MISIYFGSPGCGKSTVACKLFRKIMKTNKYKYYYSSFTTNIPSVLYMDNLNHLLGKCTPPEHSLVIDDEVGISFNNRQYKSMSIQQIEWFKLHRHFKVDYIGMSQAFDDMDITLRRLATEYWYVKKLGPWTLCRRCYKFTTIDDNTHQIIDGYKLANGFSLFTSFFAFILRPIPLLRDVFQQKWTLTFRPFYYKWFDSFAHPKLQEFPKVDKK